MSHSPMELILFSLNANDIGNIIIVIIIIIINLASLVHPIIKSVGAWHKRVIHQVSHRRVWAVPKLENLLLQRQNAEIL